MSSIIIAIDGPAASGKSTIASRLAKKLNGFYVNTGNMYRSFTFAALRKGTAVTIQSPQTVETFIRNLNLIFDIDHNKEMLIFLDSQPLGDEIRSPEISHNVSSFAKISAVRQWLVDKQRQFANKYDGYLVMEGRDIGTIVFPQAKFKFFLTASPEVRAARRLAQDGEVPSGATIAMVAEEIARRDKIDSSRNDSPLRMAEDAMLIDSSTMTIDRVVDQLYNIIKH